MPFGEGGFAGAAGGADGVSKEETNCFQLDCTLDTLWETHRSRESRPCLMELKVLYQRRKGRHRHLESTCYQQSRYFDRENGCKKKAF